MTREEFLHALIINGFDPASILTDNAAKDGYGIRKLYWRWEIFFRERGVEYYTRGYPSESEALIALLEDILHHQ